MIEFHIAYKNGREDFHYGKQVIGPDFKNRVFVLCSVFQMNKDFVEGVKYFVAEYASATIWGISDTKAGAISEARSLIRDARRSGKFLDCLKDGCKRQRPFRASRAARLADFKKYLEKCREPKPITNALKKKVWATSDGKCHYCRTEISEKTGWHLEHKQPRTRGGTDELHNLAVACPTCNLQKNNMTEAEFFSHRKFKSQVAA